MSFTLVLLMLAAQAVGAQVPLASAKVPLNKEFSLKIGQAAVINAQKVSLKFITVHDDSRCPTGVQCVWAGNAAVVVELSKNKKKLVQATLNTSIKPNELEYKDYKIKLVGLNPYPKADQRINQKDYQAVLIVTKE